MGPEEKQSRQRAQQAQRPSRCRRLAEAEMGKGFLDTRPKRQPRQDQIMSLLRYGCKDLNLFSK